MDVSMSDPNHKVQQEVLPNGLVVITQLQPITAIFPIPEDNVTKVMQRLHDGATRAGLSVLP